MKSLIQSTILVVSLSTLSFTSSSAIDTHIATDTHIAKDTQIGPRCDPYPECQMTINKQPQALENTTSDINRFDKLLTSIS